VEWQAKGEHGVQHANIFGDQARPDGVDGAPPGCGLGVADCHGGGRRRGDGRGDGAGGVVYAGTNQDNLYALNAATGARL
jgi:hypothetical protein